MSELTWEERVIAKLDSIESMATQAIAERNSLRALNADLMAALEEMIMLAENERVRETNLALIHARAALSRAKGRKE